MLAVCIGLLAVPAAAGVSLPFGSATYSADEDAQWTVAGSGSLPGNPWYIGGPEPGQREEWLAALQGYRRNVREQIGSLTQADIAFGGVRAWVRMRAPFAKALNLQPGEPIRIDVEARWIEGNSELVLALDWHSREDDRKLGWSTVFATLEVPQDTEWHRLTWEGRWPEFDPSRQWAKPIFGMDATHDATPGRVSVREFSLAVPERVETPVRELLSSLPASAALDRSIYDRRDLAWASRAFVCHFAFMYDLSFYDPAAGRFTVERFLQEGEREFGGYDGVVLWHAYPRIGVDERNQFDFYRDMPGGLPGLRKVIGQLHARGVRAFIDYNPWDVGTRREGMPDHEAIATMVAAIDADGVFLDTMSAGAMELRRAVDAVRPGVILEPEGSPAIDQLAICNASWAQGLPPPAEPGLLRLKCIEPRHMQHQISRWSGSHAGELEMAFLNGSGMLVWENVFGTWNPWQAQDRAALRRMAPILRAFAGNFASDAWDPLVPTLVEGVYANRWPGDDADVWTVLNQTGETVKRPFLRVPLAKAERILDLWRGEELSPQIVEGEAAIAADLGPMGCIAVSHNARGERLLGRLAARQQDEAARSIGDDPHVASENVIEPLPVERTPPAAPDDPPPGMVLVPAGAVTMHLTHQRRECGCYPDPGTPPERWREFLWGAPFNGSIEHHIGPTDLPAYFIDEHEVTNGEFARFLRESGYRPRCRTNFVRHWGGTSPPREITDHPVVYVDLEDARTYARWAGKRLPTEPEWHRAAQGDDGRAWPWGDDFDPSRCNGCGEGTTPVTEFPQGRSPFGCLDMAGNVWEWTESERSDGHTRFCIIRGGSYFRAEGSVWYVPGGPQPITSHAKFVLMYPGLDRCSTIGFRCVKDLRGGG